MRHSVSRFATLLDGVPIPMMQQYRIVPCFDAHKLTYEESPSSSSADISDGPKEDDEDSHHNLAWHPVPQPRHKVSPPGGGGGVVENSTMGKEMLSTHVKNTHTVRTACVSFSEW